MNGVGFEILARIPVPKLPPSYPPRLSYLIYFKLHFLCTIINYWQLVVHINSYLRSRSHVLTVSKQNKHILVQTVIVGCRTSIYLKITTFGHTV